MNHDIRMFDGRVNFIIEDTDRILALSKSSVILREFDESIVLLNSYLGEMATLDQGMKQIMDARRARRPITPEEEIADKAFADKRADVVDKLKKAIDTVGKRRRVIVRIADGISKRSNSKTEKQSPKVSSAKSSPKNSTRKVVISQGFAESRGRSKSAIFGRNEVSYENIPSKKTEKDLNKEQLELKKAQLKLEKEREQQSKLLAKEREHQEKLLAKEKDKMAKQLAKEQDKMAKQLAKEKDKMAKQLAKEKDKMAKQLAKEKDKMAKVVKISGSEVKM